MFNVVFYQKIKNLGGGADTYGFCKYHKNEDFFEHLVSISMKEEPREGMKIKLGNHFYCILMMYLDLDTSCYMCLVSHEIFL